MFFIWRSLYFNEHSTSTRPSPWYANDPTPSGEAANGEARVNYKPTIPQLKLFMYAFYFWFVLFLCLFLIPYAKCSTLDIYDAGATVNCCSAHVSLYLSFALVQLWSGQKVFNICITGPYHLHVIVYILVKGPVQKLPKKHLSWILKSFK